MRKVYIFIYYFICVCFMHTFARYKSKLMNEIIMLKGDKDVCC